MDININLNVNFPQLDKMYELLFQILEEAKAKKEDVSGLSADIKVKCP